MAKSKVADKKKKFTSKKASSIKKTVKKPTKKEVVKKSKGASKKPISKQLNMGFFQVLVERFSKKKGIFC